MFGSTLRFNRPHDYVPDAHVEGGAGLPCAAVARNVEIASLAVANAVATVAAGTAGIAAGMVDANPQVKNERCVLMLGRPCGCASESTLACLHLECAIAFAHAPHLMSYRNTWSRVTYKQPLSLSLSLSLSCCNPCAYPSKVALVAAANKLASLMQVTKKARRVHVGV